MENAILREIRKEDNPQVSEVIRTVLDAFGVPKVGTAYADKALDYMFEHYDKPKATYFVVEEDDKIIGCAGVAQLDNYGGNICELQKMYFLEAARGRGLGKAMITICLERAQEFGFEACYLETMPYMETAQKLYKQMGFEYLDRPLGNTGHYSCPVWMLKKL